MRVPGIVRRQWMLRMRSVTHEVRAMVEGETAHLVHASFVAVERVRVAHVPEHRSEHLDDTAGGEFVDDRIRLRE